MIIKINERHQVVVEVMKRFILLLPYLESSESKIICLYLPVRGSPVGLWDRNYTVSYK